MLADHQILPPNKMNDPARVAMLKQQMRDLSVAMGCEKPWFESRKNLCDLFAWLRDHDGWDCSDLLYFMNYPMKLNEDWKRFQLEKANGMDCQLHLSGEEIVHDKRATSV